MKRTHNKQYTKNGHTTHQHMHMHTQTHVPAVVTIVSRQKAEPLNQNNSEKKKKKTNEEKRPPRSPTHPNPAITGTAIAAFLASKTGVSARRRKTTDKAPAVPSATREM